MLQSFQYLRENLTFSFREYFRRQLRHQVRVSTNRWTRNSCAGHGFMFGRSRVSLHKTAEPRVGVGPKRKQGKSRRILAPSLELGPFVRGGNTRWRGVANAVPQPSAPQLRPTFIRIPLGALHQTFREDWRRLWANPQQRLQGRVRRDSLWRTRHHRRPCRIGLEIVQDQPVQPLGDRFAARARPVGRVELEVADRLAEGGGCASARLEFALVQVRPDHHEAAQVRRLRGALQQDLPRKLGGLAGRGFFDRLGRRVEHARRIVERDLALLHACQHERERLHEAAQALVARQRADERRRGRQPRRHPFELVDRCEQKAVAAEESVGVLRLDRAEDILLLGELLRQRPAGGARHFWRRSVDHDQDELRALGERIAIRDLALSPIEIRRHQVIDVRIDREVERRIGGRPDGQDKRNQDDRPGMPDAEIQRAHDG